MNNEHQKHAKLARAHTNEFARCELAILGTDCSTIRQLAYTLIHKLANHKTGYADADHKTENAHGHSVSAIGNGAFAEYTNKVSFTRVDMKKEATAFEKRMWLNDCELVLLNGNHFPSAKQVLVIDAAKPMVQKLDRLADVQLILLKDADVHIPEAIQQHLPRFSSIPQLSIRDTDSIAMFIEQYIEHQLPEVYGLVLAGGKSTRMGTDKSSLQYHGVSQRNYVSRLLSSYCEKVFLSANHEQAKDSAFDLPCIEDSFLGLGPVGGILSAFQRYPGKAWLTIACDLPFINADTISYLVQHRNPGKMATAFMDAENQFPEPLITIWEPRAYSQLLLFLSQGYSCPRKTLINSDVELLQAPDASTFKNVNTTEEYTKPKYIEQQA